MDFCLLTRILSDSYFHRKAIKVSVYYLVFCSEETCSICKTGRVWGKGSSASIVGFSDPN